MNRIDGLIVIGLVSTIASLSRTRSCDLG